MTRLFAFLPLIAGALATMGGDVKGASGEEQSFEIDIGPIKIKVIGSFSGQGKWNWAADRPGDNATIHQVKVGDMKDGKPNLAYDPPSLDALPGDYVQFNFMAQNHTVTQSTLEKPCVKMAGGMDSGFMPNPNNTMPTPPSMMIAVNDSKPLWFYCRQKEHCGKGMAFGINPGGAEKMAQFMTNAKSQNGSAPAAAAGAPGAAAAAADNSTSAQNGLPESKAVPAPSATPLTDLVPGAAPAAPAPGSGEGAGAGGAGGSPSGSGSGSGTGAPGAGGAANDSASGGGASGAGAGADAAGALKDECACNCLCDIGQAVLGGGFLNSAPLPQATGINRRTFRTY